MFNYKYRLKFQLAMNDMYFLQNWGGGGGVSGLDYVILLSEGGGGGWVLITVDYGGGVKKCQKFDNVICERPLMS